MEFHFCLQVLLAQSTNIASRAFLSTAGYHSWARSSSDRMDSQRLQTCGCPFPLVFSLFSSFPPAPLCLAISTVLFFVLFLLCLLAVNGKPILWIESKGTHQFCSLFCWSSFFFSFQYSICQPRLVTQKRISGI